MEARQIKMELYHDNYQNFRRYDIPKAQLVIADIPYNVGKMPMPVALNGITAEITETERARKLKVHSSRRMAISRLLNICTSATGF